MKSAALITAGSQPASLAAIATHLAVSRQVAEQFLARGGYKQLPAGRYDLSDLWRGMWRIRSVPLEYVTEMAMPLLSIDDVAALVGVSAQTIRRAGNSNDLRWNLPAHFDLGPRVRRYLPLHIRAWINQEPLDHWLRPQLGPAPTKLGLVGRNRSEDRAHR